MSAVVTGKPGAAYVCPDHGRFVPDEPPRYDVGDPCAKCMAWLPGGLSYCGKYCPPLIVLELTPDEAMCMVGALTVSAMLRNTLAPITDEGLAAGRLERDLSVRVLLVLAEYEGKNYPVDSHAPDCTCMGSR